MIQLNLLPSVKIKYIKSRRHKRLVMLVSGLVGLGSLSLMTLMLVYVFIVQGTQIAGVNDSIKKRSDSIGQKRSQVDDINKVLTVQNQLVSLDTLHENKPVTSRIYDYLARMTPSELFITKLNVNLVEGAETITIQGTTDTLETVNKFADTLKFTKFTPAGEDVEAEVVFTEVVLTDFSRDKKGASYTVNMKFSPIIFSSLNESAGLVVPKGLITTRSELGRPILRIDTEVPANPDADEESN